MPTAQAGGHPDLPGGRAPDEGFDAHLDAGEAGLGAAPANGGASPGAAAFAGTPAKSGTADTKSAAEKAGAPLPQQPTLAGPDDHPSGNLPRRADSLPDTALTIADPRGVPIRPDASGEPEPPADEPGESEHRQMEATDLETLPVPVENPGQNTPPADAAPPSPRSEVAAAPALPPIVTAAATGPAGGSEPGVEPSARPSAAPGAQERIAAALADTPDLSSPLPLAPGKTNDDKAPQPSAGARRPVPAAGDATAEAKVDFQDAEAKPRAGTPPAPGKASPGTPDGDPPQRTLQGLRQALNVPDREITSARAPSARADADTANAAQLSAANISGAPSGTAPSGPMPPPLPTYAPAVPVQGVAVEIAARVRDGKNRFEIRLDPPELGRVEVKLDIDGDGNVTSRLVVDRSETLDLLRRHAPALERALESAGLTTSQGGLEFSLRDQALGSDAPNEPPMPAVVRPVIAVVDDAQAIAAAQRLYQLRLGLGAGIDIRV